MDNNPYRPATADPAANAQAGPGSHHRPGPVTPSILLMSGVCGLIGLLLTGYIAWQLQQQRLPADTRALQMLLNAGFYLLMAYGTYRRSRICACVLLVYTLLHAFMLMLALSPLPAYVLLFPLVLLAILITGTLAVFRAHRAA